MLKRNKPSRLRSREMLKHPEGSIFQDGYGQIPKLVMCDRGLTPTAKLLYSYLCSYSGGGNQAYPGISRMCADLVISKNTFYKHMKQLEESGYIKKTQYLDPRNHFTNNIYEFVYKIPSKRFKDKQKVIDIDF
jgi:predicted transcriptional regulator